MNDTELVIKIPDRIYYGIEKGITVNGSQASQILIDAVKCGTPLQKEHGDLICRDTIANYVNSHILEINTGYGDLNQHTNRILRMIEDYIYKMPTIIEADY